jgi:hypothetical protein
MILKSLWKGQKLGIPAMQQLIAVGGAASGLECGQHEEPHAV